MLSCINFKKGGRRRYRTERNTNESFNNYLKQHMGSFVKIQCEKCHKEKDISDDARSNW